MRILTVNVHYDPESFGGATIVAEEVSRHLQARGHTVAALTGTTDPSLLPGQFYRYEAGIPVVAMGRLIPTTTFTEYHQPLLGERFKVVLESLQPDVVHFHAIQALGVEMVHSSIESGAATVVTLHDAWWLCERQFMVRADGNWCRQSAIEATVCATCVPDPAAHALRQAESRELLNACDAVLTPSDYWHDLMSASGIDAGILRVNRNGVLHPPPDFRRSSHRGPVRFGYVGGDNPIKGAPQLREALSGMTRSDYKLSIVDASLKLGHTGVFAEDWQYSGQIEVVPGYAHSDMDAFFNSIDVLLFPSQWHESYGLTVREAILRGTWVIATEGGGAAEDLQDGVNSTLIPLDGTGEGLRAAIEQILDDPAAYLGRAHPIREIPTYADQAIELEQIYTQIVAG